MRYTGVFLFGLLIGGLASINTYGPSKVESSQALGGEWLNGRTSVKTHLAILETYELHMTETKKRMQRLETRLAYLAKKPYMDPKGFRRDGATRMLGHLRNEMESIEQRIAGHRAQIWKLQAFITSEEPQPTTNHESMALESADLNKKVLIGRWRQRIIWRKDVPYTWLNYEKRLDFVILLAHVNQVNDIADSDDILGPAHVRRIPVYPL